MVAAYPEEAAPRRHWIQERRGERDVVDAWRPHAFFIEEEYSESRTIVPVATVFLTNRECPWRCLMCDLWKNTLTESVPAGAIPAQIDHALTNLAHHRVRQIKLYNSGSFFDERAVPRSDHEEIARRVSQFERVIVECHPKLVSDSVLKFRDLIGTELEVAMGLETANPETLARLNKGMTLDDFANAAGFLTRNGVSVRAFILLKPPFTTEADGVLWAKRSIDFAFDCGVSVACVIPTRPGNGALDVLGAIGGFSPPRLRSLEDVVDYGIGLKGGRVFADVWDLERFSECEVCFGARKQRLNTINLTQQPQPVVVCPQCER